MFPVQRFILVPLLLTACFLAPPALARPGRQVLVLGIRGPAFDRERAREAVRQRLHHMGEEAAAPALSDADLSCRRAPCFSALADRHGADRMVGGEVLENDRSYLIKLWLFSVASQDLREAQGACEDCSREDLTKAIAVTAGRLLDRPAAPPEPVAQPAPPPPPPRQPARVPGPDPISTHKPPPPPLPAWRKGLAGTLGGIAAATLITAIALTVKNGTPSGLCEVRGDVYDSCHKDFTAGAALSYTASGLSIAGMILTLTLPVGSR